MINLRTQQAKRREVATQQRVRVALERVAEKSMQNALNEMGAKAEQDFRKGGELKAMTGTVDFEDHIAKILKQIYARAISVGAARMMSTLQGKSAGDILEQKADDDDLLTDEELGDIIKSYARVNAGKKARQIGETTRTRIARAVSQGAEDGLGIDAIAKLIKEKTYGVINGYRAKMIAQTETHGAMQYGSLEAADATGVVTTKTWISAADARTREDHIDMNDQTVPMADDFHGAAEGMSFPGDPAGPPEQVINCRCILVYGTEG